MTDCHAQGSRSSLSYIVESTFGTTPAGNFANLPYLTHSLNLNKERVAGNDIQADRMPRVDRHGNRQVGGDIVVDLRKGDYDVLIESAMMSTFSADVIKIGTAAKYLSIEDYSADIDQGRLFSGCTMSTMNISIAPNQMVTTTFGAVGKDMSTTQTPKTQDAASDNKPFDSYSGTLSIGDVGNATASAIVTKINFSLNNSFAPTFVIGSDTAPCLEYGRAEVEGNLTAYFADADLINRFLNETESEISVSVNDPTGSSLYTFLFPRVKINSADTGVDGPNSRVINMSFVSLYDSTEETNLKITRS